ncbi:hypothetical protein [Epibacterium ulvae]|uniref:hypothetical protein n=1 Tax=Epibacterium ulvae TaxID=1156985 RepID=UPI002493914A|nr:hypothetical protein [Epibacterium ulvae]
MSEFDIQTLKEITEVATSALKSTERGVSLVGTVKGLFEKSEAAGNSDLKARVSELSAQVTDAALANTKLKLQLAELLNELNEQKARNDKLARYELTERKSGSFVLKLRQEQQGNEPMHSICPNCADRRKHIVLQPKYHGMGTFNLVCPDCEADFGHLRSVPYDVA